MTTNIRPVISRRNRYWISKHRYYELKHFCLQYYEWKKTYSQLDDVCVNGIDSFAIGRKEVHAKSDPVSKYAVLLAHYKTLMSLVEETANETDSEIGKYLFESVTKGCTYEQLRATKEIPCSRDMFYDRYRKFFWLLDKKR